MDQEENSSIQKIVEYVKDKQIVTWDEIAEFAGQFGHAAPDMEQIAKALAENNLQPVELPEDDADDEQDTADDEVLLEEDPDEAVAAEPEVKEDTYDKNKLVNSDKESNVDDPIRLYLREIGKENLLNAEQEVSLSKQMEEGKNINTDIRSLVKKEVLSGQVVKVADTLRITGNNAVHPGQIVDEDFDKVAAKMFDLINFIVKKAITEPKELDELYQLMPENARTAAEAQDKRNLQNQVQNPPSSPIQK